MNHQKKVPTKTICLTPKGETESLPLQIRLILNQLSIPVAETHASSTDRETYSQYILWFPTAGQAIKTIEQSLPAAAKYWIITKERPLFSDLLILHLNAFQISILLEDPEQVKLRSFHNWLRDTPLPRQRACASFGFPQSRTNTSLDSNNNREISVNDFTQTWEYKIKYLYVVSRIAEGPIPDLMQFMATEMVAEEKLSWNEWMDFIHRFNESTLNLLKVLCLSDGHPEACSWIADEAPTIHPQSQLAEYASIQAARNRLFAGDPSTAKRLLEILDQNNPLTAEGIKSTLSNILLRADTESVVYFLSTLCGLDLFSLDDAFLEWLSPKTNQVTLYHLALELTTIEQAEQAKQARGFLSQASRSKFKPKDPTLSGLIARIAKDRGNPDFFECVQKHDICNQNSNTFYIAAKLTTLWSLIYQAKSDSIQKTIPLIDLRSITEKSHIKVLSNIYLALKKYTEAEELINHVAALEKPNVNIESYRFRLLSCRDNASIEKEKFTLKTRPTDDSRFWLGRLHLNKGEPNSFQLIDSVDLDSQAPSKLALRFNQALALRRNEQPETAIYHFKAVFSYHPTNIWQWMSAFEIALTHLHLGQIKKAVVAATLGCHVRSTMIKSRINPCFFLLAYLKAITGKNPTDRVKAHDTAKFCAKHWMAPQFGIQRWARVFAKLTDPSNDFCPQAPTSKNIGDRKSKLLGFLHASLDQNSFESKLITQLLNQDA